MVKGGVWADTLLGFSISTGMTPEKYRRVGFDMCIMTPERAGVFVSRGFGDDDVPVSKVLRFHLKLKFISCPS